MMVGCDLLGKVALGIFILDGGDTIGPFRGSWPGSESHVLHNGGLLRWHVWDPKSPKSPKRGSMRSVCFDRGVTCDCLQANVCEQPVCTLVLNSVCNRSQKHFVWMLFGVGVRHIFWLQPWHCSTPLSYSNYRSTASCFFWYYFFVILVIFF